MGKGNNMYEEMARKVQRREQLEHISNKRPLTLAEQNELEQLRKRLQELKEETQRKL